MPLGNTIHDVCGHVMAKLHIIPINIHEVTSGCYKLTSALVPHYGATPLTYPRPPPVHFRTSHYSSVRVFVNRYPHYVTMSSHCVHTLYSSVRVFVNRFPMERRPPTRSQGPPTTDGSPGAARLALRARPAAHGSAVPPSSGDGAGPSPPTPPPSGHSADVPHVVPPPAGDAPHTTAPPTGPGDSKGESTGAGTGLTGHTGAGTGAGHTGTGAGHTGAQVHPPSSLSSLRPSAPLPPDAPWEPAVRGLQVAVGQLSQDMRALMEALQDRGADNDSVVEEEVAPPPATKVARAQGLLAQLGRAVGFNARGAPTPAAPSRRPPAAAPPAPSAPPAKRTHLDALIARDDAADRELDLDGGDIDPNDQSDGLGRTSTGGPAGSPQDVLDTPLAPWLMDIVNTHHGGSFLAWSLRITWSSKATIHQVNTLVHAMDAMLVDFPDQAATSKSFEILARRLSAIYMNEQGYGWDVGNTLEPADPLNIIPRHLLKAALREVKLRKTVAPSAEPSGTKSKWSGSTPSKSPKTEPKSSNPKRKAQPKSERKNNNNESKRTAPSPPSSGGAGAST